MLWILGSVLSLLATTETRKFAVRDETRNKLNFNTACYVTSWKKFFLSFKAWLFWLLSIVIKHRIVENNLVLAAGPGRIKIEIIKFKFRNFDNKQPALVTKFSLTLFVFLLRPFQFLAIPSHFRVSWGS